MSDYPFFALVSTLDLPVLPQLEAIRILQVAVIGKGLVISISSSDLHSD